MKDKLKHRYSFLFRHWWQHSQIHLNKIFK